MARHALFHGRRACRAGVDGSPDPDQRPADPVPDQVWSEADKHFDEAELAALILAIANINVWNRLNVAVRQPAGVWKG